MLCNAVDNCLLMLLFVVVVVVVAHWTWEEEEMVMDVVDEVDANPLCIPEMLNLVVGVGGGGLGAEDEDVRTFPHNNRNICANTSSQRVMKV